jgi:signal transduction histidine kinase/DNA-binding NarL/FixJ family response regulator
MKYRFTYFFWILLLALSLMLLILAAQIFTDRNINGLKSGNKEAAVTFTINNSLQELVNISFALETRLAQKNTGKQELNTIKDSLAVIGYNASVLQKLNLDTQTRKLFGDLNFFISKQVAFSYKNIDAIESGNESLKTVLADSLVSLNFSDSIYNTAVAIGKQLEKKLQATLNQNTEASRELSAYNKALALIAIIAILILGTIIINRHLRQLQLIKDLESANAEVQKSAQVKGNFLANMSHEIRTPLNAIKGFSWLMLQTPLTKEQKQYAEIIQNSSNNLLQLVNDILDISKIEAGKMVMERKEFRLPKLLQTLELMFMNEANEKLLDYSCVMARNVPSGLKGDEDRLYQILINLVGNAIKFTSAGFIKVSVEYLSEVTSAVWLRFKVEDSGIGIAQDKTNIIFERFQQINDNLGTPQQGTGLGLAIVKELCVLLGGDITVQSKMGEGSVFTVTLPFQLTAGKIQDDVAEAKLPVAYPDLSLSKVLVAEDNKVNQLLIKHMLKLYGIEPQLRENGIGVIELLAQQSFDLLLLDIQMPLMDGYQVASEIRKRNLPVPVVAMTAYAMPEEKEKCIAAGMDGYIAKPLNEQELYTILQTYLKPAGSNSFNTEQTEIHQQFLMNISGGDRQMANIILKEVKKQLPGEIEKLSVIIDERNINGLSALCHHLISTISPLGNDTEPLKKIAVIQKTIAEQAATEKVLHLAAELKNELSIFYNNLNSKQQV